MSTSARILADVDVFVIMFLFWAGVLFTVSVSTFWPWWKNALGRTTILVEASLTTALLPSNLGLMFGFNTEAKFWQWWVAVTFFSAGVSILWRIPVIWKIQRYEPGGVVTWMKSKMEKKEGEDAADSVCPDSD